MDSLRKPIVRHSTLAALGSTATQDFNEVRGAIHIKNIGPGKIYANFTDTVPNNWPQDGQFELGAGEWYNADNVYFRYVSVLAQDNASEVNFIAYTASLGVQQ